MKICQLDPFHIGHVISEKNGGTLDISNLRPICSGCNSSMKCTNMREFIKTYYKQNLKAFDNNILSVKKKNNFFSSFFK